MAPLGLFSPSLHPPSNTMTLTQSHMAPSLTDHDYVLKVKDAPDAMLSSSALDLETIMSDIDFTDDLADLNLGLPDLEPGEEFQMEDSFQDFIDSALDKSFYSLQWEIEEAQATERANKEDFMRGLGLHSSTTCRPDVNSSDTARHQILSQQSQSDSCATIPTKECTCSQHCCGARAVYSTAGLRSPDVMSSSTAHFHMFSHVPNNTEPQTVPVHRAIGSCLNCIKNRDVLAEFSKPLTIDVTSGTDDDAIALQCLQMELFHSGGGHRQASERLQHPVTQDRDTDDLLMWLNTNQTYFDQVSHKVPSVNNSTTSHTFQGSTQCNSDEDSYMDLEDFLNNEALDANHPCQPDVQHDHTYQKALSEDNSQKAPQSSSNVSFLSNVSDQSDFHDHSISFMCQTPLVRSEKPDSLSLSSTTSSPLSSPRSSPYPSPTSIQSPDQSFLWPSEKNHLDLLSLFSDDLSSSALSAGSPVAQFRFM